MDKAQHLQRYKEARRLLEREEVKQAFARFQSLAEQGYPPAQDFLGWMYLVGTGIERDPGRARSLFQQAAAAGDAWGQYHVGALERQTGRHNEARAWFEKAASQGHLPALYRLGQMYEAGEGVSADEETALEYYAEAGAKGHAFARRNLCRIMTRREVSVLRRVRWRLKLVANLWYGLRLRLAAGPYDERLGTH